MKMIKVLILIFPLFFCGLTGCSTTADPADAYPNETPQHIFQKGEKALRSHSYGEAIKRFEALDVQYPFGRETEIAQLHIIYAYYMKEDYASAEAAATRFILAHPISPHVDYAYYMRGLSNFYQNLGLFERLFSVNLATRDLSQIKKTFGDFSTLVERYPHSYYAPAAYQYMIYLRNMLAEHQLQVAQYYYSRAAYVAAANRASLVAKHYQGSPSVPPALVIMVKSYRALHMEENANEAMRVLQYNYPGSSITP